MTPAETLTPEPQDDADVQAPFAAPGKPLSEAAQRALHEAAARRAQAETASGEAEHGGPKGPEPTRYGDWEHKGLAIDF